MTPIRFAFGIHLHQPVGNFDHVFAQHVEDVYRPLLDTLADAVRKRRLKEEAGTEAE